MSVYSDIKDKTSKELTATQWTPYRTLIVAGGTLLVLGIVTVIIIKAKNRR